MGRLIMKDLKPVHVFKLVERDSGYVGTEKVPIFFYTIRANVQPAENKVIAEVYGERVYNMLSVIAPSSAQIDETSELSFGWGGEAAPTHKVISVKHYSDHLVILAEKVM